MERETRKNLSNSEWIVMNGVAEMCQIEHDVTVSEMVKKLSDNKNWSVSTVKTILERLVDKGALSCVVRGKTCFYKPIVERNTIALRDIADRLDSILSDTFSPLVAYLANRQKLTQKQIFELEKMLDDSKKGGLK